MNNNIISSKMFLNAKDIANMLDISYTKALDFIKYSGIQYIKIGNQYRITQEAFNKFTNPSKGNLIVNL